MVYPNYATPKFSKSSNILYFVNRKSINVLRKTDINSVFAVILQSKFNMFLAIKGSVADSIILDRQQRATIYEKFGCKCQYRYTHINPRTVAIPIVAKKPNIIRFWALIIIIQSLPSPLTDLRWYELKLDQKFVDQCLLLLICLEQNRLFLRIFSSEISIKSL